MIMQKRSACISLAILRTAEEPAQDLYDSSLPVRSRMQIASYFGCLTLIFLSIVGPLQSEKTPLLET